MKSDQKEKEKIIVIIIIIKEVGFQKQRKREGERKGSEGSAVRASERARSARRLKQDKVFFLLNPRIRRLDGHCFYRFPVSDLMDGSTTKASIFICHLVGLRRGGERR